MPVRLTTEGLIVKFSGEVDAGVWVAGESYVETPIDPTIQVQLRLKAWGTMEIPWCSVI